MGLEQGRGQGRRAAGALTLAAAGALAACSPVYVLKSAAGHAKLLARRQSIARAIADPETPPALKERLRTVVSAREFGFERMGLRRTRDYSTYAEVDGPALTYLVWGCEKTRLEAHQWRFPLIGRFPYKGHFKEADARREARRLEAKGLDSHVSGAAAYNTPLWVSDPLPSTALSPSTGAVAALILHELTHATVFIKGQVEFNESLASFVGDLGAEHFLLGRPGGAAELAEFRALRERERRLDDALDALRQRLEALYGRGLPREATLAAREAVFSEAREPLRALGFDPGALNNAVLIAHRAYRSDREPLAAAYERLSGGDWKSFFALVRSLDPKDPSGDLRRRVGR